MLETVMLMEKMATLGVIFLRPGMLRGSTSAWEAGYKQAFGYEDPDAEEDPTDVDNHNAPAEQAPEHHDVADVCASDTLNSDTCILLAVKRRMCSPFRMLSASLTGTLQQSLVILIDSMTLLQPLDTMSFRGR
jgi:hypothetical protein